jgi:DNA-binding transcriptional MerR regulator
MTEKLYPWDDLVPEGVDAVESAAELSAEVPAEPSAEQTGERTGELTGELTGDLTGEPTGEHAGQPAGEPAPAGEVSAARGRKLVRKEYYSISEVADLVGLPAHVLRYWESQFSVLNPSKNRSGNRVYQRKEIKLILLVKQLLHEEKYTVEGAKQKLEQLRRGGGIQDASAHALNEQVMRTLRDELRALSTLLSAEEE